MTYLNQQESSTMTIKTMSHNWQKLWFLLWGYIYLFFYKYVICLQSFHIFVKHHAPSAIYLAYIHFNPWYQDVSTLTCSDTSTHDIKTFQPLYVQTFQPFLFRHFNPCFECFLHIHLSFSTPNSNPSQPLYRRRFNP